MDRRPSDRPSRDQICGSGDRIAKIGISWAERAAFQIAIGAMKCCHSQMLMWHLWVQTFSTQRDLLPGSLRLRHTPTDWNCSIRRKLSPMGYWFAEVILWFSPQECCGAP